MGIELKNVTKTFDGKMVLDNISLDFPESGVFALMAPSGYGKTTLLRLIAGLEKPDSGKISIGDKISFLFQDSLLFPWLTAKENITEIAGVSEKKAQDLLGKMELLADSDLYPDQLSGGMQRRVSLARAIARGGILLLDEPFNGLDEELKHNMYGIIKEYAKENLVIMVTHNEDEATKCGGKIISFG
ncbi:MAG: ATP-binding cassette domain-containing protein [Ruminococcaceae bacterium]|nr:ATP-binding cassette domain-containing protein [Oscillospiraceae bacterium]